MQKHVENPDARYHSINFMCKDTNMSRNTLMKLALEAGAVIQIGSRNKKIDAEKFYKYLDTVYSVTER